MSPTFLYEIDAPGYRSDASWVVSCGAGINTLADATPRSPRSKSFESMAGGGKNRKEKSNKWKIRGSKDRGEMKFLYNSTLVSRSR